MDIFKRLVYLIAPDGATNGPVAVTLEDMNELLEMNKRGEYPHSLTEFALEEGPDEVDETYSNVVGQDSLTRFDEQRRRRKKRSGRRNRPGNKNKSGGGESKASGNNAQQGGQGRRQQTRQAPKEAPPAHRKCQCENRQVVKTAQVSLELRGADCDGIGMWDGCVLRRNPAA